MRSNGVSGGRAVSERPSLGAGPVEQLVDRFGVGRAVVVAAALATALLSVPAVLHVADPLLFDNLQELVAAGGAAGAVLVGSRLEPSSRRLTTLLGVALGAAWLGMLAWDLSHPFGPWLKTAGDLIFVTGTGLGAVVVVDAILVGVRPDRLVGVAVDTAIIVLAGVAVIATLWQTSVVAPGDRTASVGVVILLGTSAGCAFGLIARRIGLSTPGPWLVLLGATTLGAAWLLWVGNPNAPSTVDLSDFMFSAGLLLIAFGALGWDTTQSDGPGFGRLALLLNSLLPVAAILTSLVLLAVAQGSTFSGLLGVATFAVIATAAARQLHLYARESQAHTALANRTAELEQAVAALELEITERRRLEAEHEAMQERLLQSQRLESIGRLAGGVAHDFNNLLTAIQGYADLASRALPADDPVQPDLAAVRHATDQASALTKQLLAFSRNQELRPALVDLGEVAARAEPLLRRLLGERIALVVEAAPDLWPVLVDPNQLEAIVVNLAVNARDAMESGGRLTIETANVELDDEYARTHAEVVPGPYAMLAVSDTGTGMDEATLARIFEPFFSTKGPGKGTGLGLATVYGTVRQSGGHISVYSELGRGSTFKVFLPRAEAGTVEVTERAASVPGSRAGRETILVAEDEDVVRDLVVAALRSWGYRVRAVRSGEEALEAIRGDPALVSLLLTDVVMPGIGGPELVEEARRLRPDLRAICMSGYTPVGLRREHDQQDLVFIGKPFSLDKLAATIRQVLGS